MTKNGKNRMRNGWARSLSVAVATTALLWCGGAARAQTTFGLSSCFIDSGSATLSSVMSQASTQALNGPKYPSASANDHWIFEGNFKPRSSQTKLAMFADDGANVSRAELDANGNPMAWAPVNATLGVGQALPNLAQSFQVINETWNTSKTYRLKIEYKNLYYTPTTTAPDVDGLTLFAFDGGGTISDNSDPPAPDYAWIDHLEYSIDGGQWLDNNAIVITPGSSVSFRVVKIGEVWRDGKPSWSGSAGISGNGESKAATFNTVGNYSVDVDAGNGSTASIGVSVQNQCGA